MQGESTSIASSEADVVTVALVAIVASRSPSRITAALALIVCRWFM